MDRECGFVAPESEREEEAVRTYISNAIPRRDACQRKKSSRTNQKMELIQKDVFLAFNGMFMNRLSKNPTTIRTVLSIALGKGLLKNVRVQIERNREFPTE